MQWQVLCVKEKRRTRRLLRRVPTHWEAGYGFHSCLLTFLQNLVKLQRTREFSTFAHTTFMLYTINLATSQDLLYIIEVDLLPNLVLYLVGLFTSLQSNHESLRNRS